METTFDLTNKNILITGGLGFIGSNLARVLVNANANVTIIDSLIPEYGGNFFNIRNFKDKVEVNISDIRDHFSLKYFVKNKHYIFNLAGQTSHLDSMADPFTDLDINCRAQLSLLETCKSNNPDAKIIFASTRQVYGKPDYLPVNEQHLLRPVDVNGINKMAGEWYHILYNNVYGIRSCVLRLTNTYGPGMRIKDARQTFLGVWIKDLLENKPLEVWGGGQLRDFNYVDDVVDALIATALDEKVNGLILNLGNEEVFSLKETAELMVEANSSGRYILKNFPANRQKIDIGDYYSDYSKITDLLGWKPKVDFKSGIKRTITFYEKYIQHYL